MFPLTSLLKWLIHTCKWLHCHWRPNKSSYLKGGSLVNNARNPDYYALCQTQLTLVNVYIFGAHNPKQYVGVCEYACVDLYAYKLAYICVCMHVNIELQ